MCYFPSLERLIHQLRRDLRPGPPPRSPSISSEARAPIEDLPWDKQVLRASSDGDTEIVRYLLNKQPQNFFKADDDQFIARVMAKAAGSNNPDTLQFLFDRYPELPDKYDLVQPMHTSFILNGARFAMFKVLVGRYPYLEHWTFGHMGDLLGIVACNNDIDFVNYLVERGANVSTSEFLHTPILEWMMLINENSGRYSDMIRVLRDHGAPVRADCVPPKLRIRR